MAVTLPIVNESGYYEIRLESMGGLGANLCGKMLGALGVGALGLNSASFSSYGSEKTGTPVKAYVRYSRSEREIRLHAPVREPHLLAVFHEALLHTPEVLAGCSAAARLVLHTEASPQAMLRRCQAIRRRNGTDAEERLRPEQIFCISAQKIAIETRSRINVVMLGALARASGFIPEEAAEEACRAALGAKYPDALAGNLAGVRRGYQELRSAQTEAGAAGDPGIEVSDKAGGKEAYHSAEADGQTKAEGRNEAGYDWGYATAPLGGVNPCCGNSVTADLSPSRQGYVPIFHPERCIHCALCDSTCPDLVFQFQKGVYHGSERMLNRGLDYYHCKGCLRCVEVCPVQALTAERECEYPDKPWFLPNQELLRRPETYEQTGPDGYITSEAYLTEKRMAGGEV